MLNPVQIVELSQPRCSLRFGVSPCTATGTPKCYNTWATCGDRTNMVADGRIRWRFIANRPGLWAVGDFADPDDIATNCIPVDGLSVSTSKSEINVAGILEGKSPFGVHATCTVSMQDFPWNDHVGDFYLADRSNLPPRNFWAVWTARNSFFGGMEVVIYDGYEGQTLSEMRARRYIVDTVDGPSGTGGVTIRGLDPLILAEGKRALFPAAMDVRLLSDITASQTTIRVLTNDETNLSRSFGVGGPSGVIVGSEIMFYSGYTEIELGTYDLIGVTRGVLKTTAATASADARVQRIGYFVDAPNWISARHILTEHSPVGISYLDDAEWTDEGETYLSVFRATTVISTPTPVEELMGELCQQGMFYCWWDEYRQKVRMQAVRPPRGTVTQLNRVEHIAADSAKLKRAPESVLTRVFVYYDPIDLTKTDLPNFRVVDGVIEGEGEDPRAGGESRTLEIKARWVRTTAHAQQIITRILSRYRSVPRFLSIHVAAKDRTITVGDICDVTTREIVDAEGRLLADRWQVVSWSEVKPGEIYALDLQSYQLVGRFAYWMANDAPDYASATDEQKLEGAFWADDSGLLLDGSKGYQWQ